METLRTTFELDRSLMDEAVSLLPELKSKKDVIEYALRDLVARKKQKSLLDLHGRSDLLADDYDYKAMRRDTI